jgi:putative addiction module component (TIGR02574 family)
MERDILAVMIAEKIPGLLSLSPDEKILLAADLWRDAVGAEHEEPDPALVEALRERLHYYQAHPRLVSTWEEVRARLISDKES